MKTHELKTWPEPFAAVWSGEKRYEIRQDDRGFAVGALPTPREWRPNEEAYTGRGASCLVTYLSRGPDWGLPVGLVVLSVSPPVRFT